MKKVLRKFLLLAVVFVISVCVFTQLMSRDKTENATDLAASSLPVLYMKVSDTLVNRMYGYREEMNGISMRDTVTPLSSDRSLTVSVDSGGQKIKTITYTVESCDGSVQTENSVIRSFEKDGDLQSARFQLEIPILMNQEYQLKMKLSYGEEKSAWYYTRIVQKNGIDMADYLKFVSDFSESCLDKSAAETLVPNLEPDETGNNSSFLDVNIHSSLDQISWGSLSPAMALRPVPEIKEINETTGSIVQNYVVSAQNENGGTEFYSVREFYRMRKGADKMILLDFERSAEQIFDPEAAVLTSSGISLGIAAKDTSYLANQAGDIVAFVVNGDLWSYNRSAGKCVKIFSFRSDAGVDPREEHREHDLHVIRVDDAGDVTFVAYGYMNRGNHEGESGAAVYYYSAEQNVVSEEIFVPSTTSYELLKKNLDRLSYVNSKKQMYLYLNGSLCRIDLSSGTSEVLQDNIPEECFVVSESQASAAWMESSGNSSASVITVLNLEDESRMRVTAEDGQKIRALGFINEDFVYGTAFDGDIVQDISGNPVPAMHTVRIVSLDGTTRKEYHQEGYYVTGVSVAEGLLELDRVMRTESGFVQAPADHIMNGEQQSRELVTSRTVTMDERKKQQLLLEFSSTGKKSSLLTLVPKYVTCDRRTDLVLSYDAGDAERYYVYGKGKLLDIMSSPAEAILLADENVGVVLNQTQSYIWERGNRPTETRLDAAGMPSGFQSASLEETVLRDSLGEDYELLNLCGCSREQILYFISRGSGVVVKTGENESALLTGYDMFDNSWLYHPETGETTALSDKDSIALFEQNGNVFFSYLKKPKFE